MKVIQVKEEDSVKMVQGKMRDSDLIPVAIVPFRGVSNTYPSMVDYLGECADKGWKTGFEIDYRDKKTTFQLLTPKYDTRSARNIFTTKNEDYAKLDNSGTIEDPDLFETDDYVTAVEFELSNDMWYPLLDYTNATNDSNVAQDAYDRIIQEMSRNRTSDVNFRLQVVATPISDNRWKKRQVLQKYLTAPIELLRSGVQVIDGSIDLLKSATGSMRNAKKGSKKIYSGIFGGITSTFQNMGAYTILERLDELKSKKESLRDADSTGAEKKLSSVKETIRRTEEKADRRGFVVQMRLIAAGEDKEQVENRTRDVITAIENTLSATGIESAEQSLDANPPSSDIQIQNTVNNMFGRYEGVDYHGRLDDTHALKTLRKKRRKPMILTPPEIATIMHVPDDSISDSSINRDTQQQQPQIDPDKPTRS